jgi:hypothetical protein
LSLQQSQALQAILFTAFALEYRIRRYFDVLHLSYRKRDTLGSLIQHFAPRVQAAKRLDNGQPIRLPTSWQRLERKLLDLNHVRNQVAHAKYAEIDKLLGARPARIAARGFNALIDFVRIVNAATGYDTEPPAVARRRYAPLKVPLR